MAAMHAYFGAEICFDALPVLANENAVQPSLNGIGATWSLQLQTRLCGYAQLPFCKNLSSAG
jgi:hypothetical protein